MSSDEEIPKKAISTISRYSLSGVLLATYSNARIAAEAIGGSWSYISGAAFLPKKVHTAYGYIWRRGNAPQIDITDLTSRRLHRSSPLGKKQKVVGQYDLNGDFVNSYVDTKEAGRAVGVHYQGIRKVIKGRGLTYGGFIWSSEIKKKIKVNPRIVLDTTISQYDLDGKWIRSFENPFMASKLTGVDNSSIAQALNGTVLTAGKYLWQKGARLRININELRRHERYKGSVLESHMKKKRALKSG
ncbi:NUMOD1 domain-containing DNA-binding protein [Pedobacter frigoris]|uniref:Nuclease-associated modular DNA-binding 1 domain-containing protein n=1 Tax=Pedobacter frigoris TaxID=2571272 RepID=A0A4U1CP54_9SPHI|nr:NUMOD1 domain-containing DNA-binding protein [Pedobacter frigoris]TKC08525.1 hypothetical protein FA047_00030 [Pedobacter frigoris]